MSAPDADLVGTGPEHFARRLRARMRLVGYWSVLDAVPATERLARLGFDYVALDAQHGLMGFAGLLNGLLAVDAGGRSAGLVRVDANDPASIGRALDAGATGVVVPLVDSAADAARAVESARYPPRGRRSYGPMRSGLRVGPAPRTADEAVVVLAMIETSQGLADVDAIAATEGLDGLYVGPSDLTLALGGQAPGDHGVAEAFDAALQTVLVAAERHGIAAGIHTPDGAVAAHRLDQGFTFVSIASDLTHLEAAARQHLETARPSR